MKMCTKGTHLINGSVWECRKEKCESNLGGLKHTHNYMSIIDVSFYKGHSLKVAFLPVQ